MSTPEPVPAGHVFMRIVGSREHVDLAVVRLRRIATELMVSDPEPTPYPDDFPGQVRVYVTVVKW